MPDHTSAAVRVNLGVAFRPVQHGTGVHVLGADGEVPRIVVEGFGLTDPIMTVQSGGGTADAPLPPEAGRLLGTFQFRGYDGSDSSEDPKRDRKGFSYASAQLRAVTTEPWGPENHGTMVILTTTAKGTSASGKQDGGVQFWNDDGSIQFRQYLPGNLSTVGKKGLIVSSPHARPTTGFLGLGPRTDYTLTSGAITVTGSRARVDTEAGRASDDLVRIDADGVQDGDLLLLQTKDVGRTVTARNGVAGGNLELAGDFVMSSPSKRLVLMWAASDGCWIELSRSAG
jgi:hypothetical protein